MIVIDASALVEVLLNFPLAERVSQRVFHAGETLAAPHLIDVEVAQVLRRFERRGAFSPERGVLAIEDLIEAPLSRFPIAPLLPRIWAMRSNVTAYDAAYIALAEALEASLVTLDAALGSVPHHGATVEVIR